MAALRVNRLPSGLILVIILSSSFRCQSGISVAGVVLDPLADESKNFPLVNDSPFVGETVPTNYPDFHSTHYYLENDHDEDDSITREGSVTTESHQRRSTHPPEVRCPLNRTAASSCKAGGAPVGCACDKLCHGMC